MNCLNCEKYVKEAIDSVYAQTYPNWEIIFWDNASTDSSPEIAKSYDERLRYFRGEKTITLYAARNKALEQARGDFIGFLDCDDLWMSEKLERQIPLFEDPEVGLVYSDALYFNAKGRTKRLYANRAYYVGRCFRALLRDYFLCVQTVVIRRAVLDTLNEWFDVRFNHAGDGELFRRISYGWKLEMVNEPLAKYRTYSSSIASTKLALRLKELPMILSKYRNTVPEFEKDFESEVRAFERKIDIQRAFHFLELDNRYKAISCLRPHIFASLKVFCLFTLIFMPKSFYYFARKLRDRISVNRF